MGYGSDIIICGLVLAFISLFMQWTTLAGSPASLASVYFDFIYSIFGFGAFGILAGQSLTVTTLPQLATLLALFAVPIGLVLRKGIVVSAGALLWMYASAALIIAITIGPFVALAGGLMISLGEITEMSRKKYIVGSGIAFIVVPIIIAYLLTYHPQVTYNSSAVFQRANWTTTLNITNENTCSLSIFSPPCAHTLYNVSGFYYVNATARNSTCWVISIINKSVTGTISYAIVNGYEQVGTTTSGSGGTQTSYSYFPIGTYPNMNMTYTYSNKSVALNSSTAGGVINYMNNNLLQTGCNAPTGSYSVLRHYAVV